MILMGIIIETFQSIINNKKKSGDNKGLRRYLLKLLTERPEDYYIWAELSSVCYVLDKYNEALTYAQKSYQIAPEDYWVRYIYGCALFRNLDVTIGDSEQSYSISKYRPQYYDSQSYYTRDEWTAISDIGKSFEDGLLTVHSYDSAKITGGGNSICQ